MHLDSIYIPVNIYNLLCDCAVELKQVGIGLLGENPNKNVSSDSRRGYRMRSMPELSSLSGAACTCIT